MATKVEGITHLCFFDEGKWFQGRLITEDKKQYGIFGEECGVPTGQFHQCCFDEEPAFYAVTMIDFDTKKEMIFKHVMKTNGDNCTLESDEVTFHTDELFVGEKANKHVEKFCSPKLQGRECIVCAGQMMIQMVQEDNNGDSS